MARLDVARIGRASSNHGNDDGCLGQPPDASHSDHQPVRVVSLDRVVQRPWRAWVSALHAHGTDRGEPIPSNGQPKGIPEQAGRSRGG